MILVTGGTGFVGSHLLFDLAKSGEKVRAIHRKNSDLEAVKKVFSYYTDEKNAEELFNSIEWTEADITEIPALTSAFENITRVYHCAAFVSMGAGHEKVMRRVNIKGTANVVNLCIKEKIEKLCYVSSVASLGKPVKGKIIEEDNLWNPEENHSDYAITKYGAEIEVWRGSQEGLDVVIVNPGVILGAGFWNEGSSRAFTRIDKGLKFYFPKVTGFVGVRDVVKAMKLLMASDIKNEKYILVAENLSFKKLFSKIADSINRPRPSRLIKKWMIKIAWVLQRLGAPFGVKQQFTRHSASTLYEDARYSSEKIRNELDFQFTPIAEVISETGKIYRKEH
ncbi:MAG: NAD-dependent epimerase/dehydratase family protein [Salegentibacter sp.]